MDAGTIATTRPEASMPISGEAWFAWFSVCGFRVYSLDVKA